MDFQYFLNEVNGCITAAGPCFITKYFGHVEASSREVPEVPPVLAAPSRFPEWFVNFASTNRDGARGSWSVTEKDPQHHEKGFMDECTQLALRHDDAESKTAGSDDVHAIGLVCAEDASYRDGFITLCASAQAVFYQQPTRPFLHAVYIRGALVELLVIDRSGVSCSEVMDVEKEAGQFLSLFLQYERMTNQALGMGCVFSTDDEGQYIVLDEGSKLYIDSKPVMTRRMLVGPSTVVYRARRAGSQEWSHAVKIKWPWVRDRPEKELLEVAMEKKAWGAAHLELYRELETTAALRAGLCPDKQRRFSDTAATDTAATSQESNETCTESDGPSGIMQFTEEETRRSFQDRVLICMVTSPVGRALYTFQSGLELLEALRDALKCHRSLFVDARLLHSDISHGNIIILDDDPGVPRRPRGMLIDLEGAASRDPAPARKPGYLFGTRPYVAIGYINDEAKTYRHDLESFLYLLLRMVVADREMELPKDSRLRAWEEGRWFELAERKSRDMHPDNFGRIVDEIPPAFASVKSLAIRLRALVFPLRDGTIWTGTEDSPEAIDGLYDGMISAFEDAIASEKSCQHDGQVSGMVLKED
ncbi:serine/threonine-protein kinase Sgk2 [Cordyceps militaris CM01]|uniref:Serine/threonine-protein kinase Sgk2 n=1 Tax=Cordyceps militaris (strain CM01) TaxID=983644 RepID=G3J9V0_CORMM|nr:serine/threonine-protein kinase Sgk2 [Cordyceps militaris CM01]EGX94173.1 serine/threonine-protein kinase Sgk2 [Cordyceps militaris CM01]